MQQPTVPLVTQSNIRLLHPYSKVRVTDCSKVILLQPVDAETRGVNPPLIATLRQFKLATPRHITGDLRLTLPQSVCLFVQVTLTYTGTHTHTYKTPKCPAALQPCSV